MNHKLKKTVFLFFVTVLCFCLSLNVFADSRTTPINSSTMHRTVATSTTTNVIYRDPQSLGSIWHEEGYELHPKIELPKRVTASTTLATAQYPAIFAAQATSMGLSYEKTFELDRSVTITSIQPTGTYYFYLEWGAVNLSQKVITTYSGGSTTDYSRSVSHVPYSGSYVSKIVVTM